TAVSWVPLDCVEGGQRLHFHVGAAQYDEPPPGHLDDLPRLLAGRRVPPAPGCGAPTGCGWQTSSRPPSRSTTAASSATARPAGATSAPPANRHAPPRARGRVRGVRGTRPDR